MDFHSAPSPTGRWRARRLFKCAGTIIVVLLTLILLASVKWKYVVWADTPRWQFVISGGAIQVTYFRPGGRDHGVFNYETPWWVWFCNYTDWDQVYQEWSQYALRPMIDDFGDGIATSTPLWLPIAILGVPAGWFWFRDRRRPGPGACRCGYDLTGNTSGRCPECGVATV